MGGVPLTALSVIGFPVRKIPDNALTEILRGGIDKMKEAGVAIIGGHSINDPEIKAGFAVTGIMDIKQVTANANARPGDVLILTKPLGTGIVAFASQIGRALPESVEASARSMTTLNRDASRLMVAFGAHACTDVTGFSLMGHLAEMALSSGVDVEVIWDDLPLLPHVLQYAADGILPGAIERNKESCGDRVIGDGLTAEMLDICFDAQTSGGLLIAIDAADADRFLKALHEAGVAAATMVGRVLSKGEGIVRVRTTGRRTMPAPRSMEKGAGTCTRWCNATAGRINLLRDGGSRGNAVLHRRGRVTSFVGKQGTGGTTEVHAVHGAGQPPRRPGRLHQAGYFHCVSSRPAVRAVHQEPRCQGPRKGVFRGGN